MQKRDALFGARGDETWHPQAPVVPSEQDHAGVEELFKDGIGRLKKAVRYATHAAYVHLAVSGVAPGEKFGRVQAFEALRRSCWPLLISEGVQLSDNPFHSQWREACKWAKSEELMLRLYEEHDTTTQRTILVLSAVALPD